MEVKINKIDIVGLYGNRDYAIQINDNKLIIVGENGTGKTTIFKIIYYTLACDWDELRRFKFDKVILYFDDCEVCISSELLLSVFDLDNIDRIAYYTNRDSKGRRPINSNITTNNIIKSVMKVMRNIDGRSEEDLEQLSIDSSLPYRYVRNLLEADSIVNLYEKTKMIETNFNATILYLPTYRRIEEQLINIFPYMDIEKWQNARKKTGTDRSIELIEFGMNDVETAVNSYQEKLINFSRAQQNKLTLGYLSEIINEEYEQIEIEKIRELSDDRITDILRRIEPSILSFEYKTEIRSILYQIRNNVQMPVHVKEKIICHYFLKLVDFDTDMRKEEKPLLSFIDMCNKYLVNNELNYDPQFFSCEIYNKSENEIEPHCIEFQDLSSGEKQIVSIFSQLFLSQDKQVFVFIDEPELSLSVDWQKMFLEDIVESSCCIGLLATTHSPFVFDNKLEKYVHGIHEFCTRG